MTSVRKLNTLNLVFFRDPLEHFHNILFRQNWGKHGFHKLIAAKQFFNTSDN